MGIPKLNKYIMEKCTASIQKITMNDLYEKHIAVDMSIYLYRFLSEGHFMEDLYLFLSIFKYYHIEPIIIFDGKPPPEKRELLNKRYNERQQTYQDFQEIEDKIETLDTLQDKNEIIELEKNKQMLEKKMVRVKREHIDQSIELIEAFGFSYYFAPSEADHLCAYLTNSGHTYATLSDDMDMILLGCNRVLRGFNLLKHDVFMYNTNSILQELQLSCNEMQQIVIMAGTDYNTENIVPIRSAFKYYTEYKASEKDCHFYEWLKDTYHIDTKIYMDIIELFTIENYRIMFDNFMKNNVYKKCRFNVHKIKNIMRKYNFIFVL